jgi:hypothetical protein
MVFHAYSELSSTLGILATVLLRVVLTIVKIVNNLMRPLSDKSSRHTNITIISAHTTFDLPSIRFPTFDFSDGNKPLSFPTLLSILPT